MDDGTVQKSDIVNTWLAELERARTNSPMSEWEKRCRKILKRYRYEKEAATRARKYQLLWSNIQTMQSAVYAKPPHGVVSRRFRDSDPVGRTACEVLERAINFTFDANDFDEVFRQVRDDFLLYSRGVARIYYEPDYETEDDSNEDLEDAEDIKHGSGDSAGNEGEGARSSGKENKDYASEKSRVSGGTIEGSHSLAFENVRIRFVQRGDFRHQPARVWSEVEWIAFRAFMTRAELKKRFGDKEGGTIPLDTAGKDDLDLYGDDRLRNADPQATVWEIWDKAKKRVLWIAMGHPDILEEGAPYLDLDGFYPCPKPAYGTVTTDTLAPVPDYNYYEDQCEEIDQLTARIAALSDMLKFVGFYPAGPQGEGFPEIERATSPGFENKMIAVTDWGKWKEGGGAKGFTDSLPIEAIAATIESCIKLRQQLVEDVYQIVGLSDIMRGATDPQETEGAQQLKAQFGGTRIRDRQLEISRFCRDISRLCGQVIAAYCSPQTIEKMTNIKLPTQQDVMMAQLQAQHAAQMAMLQGPPSLNGANGQQGAPGPVPSRGPGAAPFSNPLGTGQGQGSGIPNPTTPAFGPQTAQGLGMPPVPPNLDPTQEDVFGLLKDNLMRRFKIEIETDSTVSGDESQERQDRSQFIESVTKFIEAWGPMVMQKPLLAPLAGQLLLFGVRAFRIGRELEETIEETGEKMQAEAANGPPSPQPKPEDQLKLEGMKIKTAAEVQKAQIGVQTAQVSGQAKIAAVQASAQAKLTEVAGKTQLAREAHMQDAVESTREHAMAREILQLKAQLEAAKQPKVPAWPVNEKGF